MEAMIVSPAPGPTPFKPKSNIENQSGSESTFAPALDNAINNTKTSTTPNSNESRSTSSTTTPEDSQDISHGQGLPENVVSHPHHDQSLNSSTESAVKISEHLNNSGIAIKEASSILKNGKDIFALFQKVDGSLNDKQTESFDTKTIQADPAQLKNTLVQQKSIFGAQAISESSKESVVAAQFIKEPLHGAQANKTDNAVFLQNNDTISWNLAKSNGSNMLSQNPALLQFNSEDSKVNNSSAIRVERFTASAELTTNKISDNTNKIPLLSAERIAANLTDVPFQANQATMNVRDNGSSLRQDTQGQFIDAKLEYIDKKSHTQSDQQSLGSDSESTQKNSLAASTKTLDKPHESSFSQSLQNVSTEKTTASGIDTLRPGGPVFTSQIQENSILHQVLHKFRISQHLQDSRLVMKLHPAELGDLKIDVHLKGGTINANIMAQTQQVQEILEKNMPRLKSLMEEQGLVVNEITIKLDSDVSDNRNMFEDHLPQDEKDFAKRKNVASAIPFELEQELIEEADLGAQSNQSGVNVMI